MVVSGNNTPTVPAPAPNGGASQGVQGAQAVGTNGRNISLTTTVKRNLSTLGQLPTFKDWLKKDTSGKLERGKATVPGGGLDIDRPFFDENIVYCEKWCQALNLALFETNYALTNHKDCNDELAKDPITFAGLLCAAIMEPFMGHVLAGQIYDFCRNGIPFPQQAVAPSNGTATVTGIDRVSNWVNGCVCKKCNTSNEYAAPNQDDGTYICFGCR